MMWSGSHIQTYKYMWYIPYIRKGTAIPYIKISYYPSAITWSRMNVKMLWRKMVVMNPHAEDALPANWLTKNQLEDMPNSPLKQCKPVGPGLTGSTSLDSMDKGLHADDDAPA